MRAVDTNILVRLLTRDNPRQAVEADAFIERGAWVLILALAETMWVLGGPYAISATELAATLQMLLDHENLTIQDSDAVEAALQLFRLIPRWVSPIA